MNPKQPFRDASTGTGKRGRVGAWFALVFAAIGLFVAAKGANDLQRARQSRAWPSAEATILYAEVDRDTRVEPRGATAFTYAPRIRYSYTVDGRDYVGERAAFAYTATEAGARSLVERFPPGSRAPVFYNPRDPADAVLVREASAALWAVVVFGIAFFALGVALFRRARRKRA